ncbi:hypothetical protein M8C21_005973 [Ambrosia artemisiifolia]|uniref:Uncharacterized protein n=1 Tax=Ambrosia artemisiifolia TaxID=4212 RepID=A0AAD5CI96_AMBAR|nr:hypothetical protein M8C21_005973 [Ambrosia artemisiifolia]
MDIGVSASVDVNKGHTHDSTNADNEDLCVNKLGNDVIESLNVDRYGVLGSQPPHDCDFQKKDGAIDPSGSCSTSFPTTPKPVSAMKGSRAGPPQKLTVKWDPEVYDPVPTSVSHAATNNKPERQSKKKSKSKQKNGSKSSHGNKNKQKSAGKRGGV